MTAAGSSRQGDSNPSASGGGRGTAGRRGADGRRSVNGRRTRGGRIVFVIASDFSAAREVQKQILADIERNGFTGQNFFAVNLALEEALTNAIKHGNRLDPDRKVRIQASVTPQQAEIIVEDEGPGFDRSSVPDPTRLENLEKCSGRGILLIEAYMTRVSWDRGGRRLRMIRINEPESGGAT